jgi:membrane protease YdiL (CAAX protease family)
VLQGVLIRNIPELPPRRELYLGSMVMLWLLAGVVTTLAALGGLRLPVLPAPGTLMAGLPWVGVVVLAGLALVYLFRGVGVREPPLVGHLMPRTARDRRLFVLLSMTAGITEELLYRGVAFASLVALGAGVPLALAVSAAAFGALHYYQGWSGAVRSGLIGALLAVPVIVTGSLLPSMIAHTLLDLILGLIIGPRWLRTP